MRNYPENIQKDTFLKLINRAKNTEWGKTYDYDSIRTIQQFQERVPLQDYDDIKPYVTRLRKGETNVIWPGETKWFAKSSGTTSDKSKFIPVPKESLEDCHFRGGKDVLALYASQRPNTEVFLGKSLTLGGSHKIDQFNNQAFYGDLSAILIETLPFWADFKRTPKSDVALIDDFEEKLDKLAKESINENVTSLAGVPSWNLVMIKYLLEYTGKNNLLEIWPNLELFIHGGIAFTPYEKQFKHFIPSDKMEYMETYNASEGFFAIQDDLHTTDMLLMLDLGVFFEFIPMEEIEKDHPKTLTIGEVEKNKNYGLVISTNGGLWRYIIGDTIHFTSLYPHKIKISGRIKHFINAFGEELIIDNAENGLNEACKHTGAEISDYTAAPIYMDEKSSGAHEWLIEFSQEPDDLDKFTQKLDEALKSLNSDYEAKRYRDMTLSLPKVHKLRPGTFYHWMEKKGKLGGQNKVPRLSNDRRYVDQLLEILHDE
jgi:hypothetical protein